MTLKLRNILPFTLATILFAACTDELPVERTQQQYYFDGDYYFVLEDENASMSRMQYDGIIKSEFTTGDRIGIFAPQSEDKSLILNDVFSARDLKEPSDPPRQVLVPCDDEIKKEVPKNEDEYLLYFPHTATQSLERLTKGMSHTVKEDQSVKANLTDSDLLWCHKLMTETDKKETYVTINMHHAMATIVVKVAKDSIDTSRSVVLPSMPTQATGVILRKETEEVTTDNLQYNVETEKSRKDISMYKLPDDTDEYNYVYRAVVPACQTLQKDTDILTLHLKDKRGEYVETTYKLAQDVTLRPGKYYTFNLRAGLKPAIPDVTDDESWVLDVFDPDEPHALVGLLCREYLHFQPDQTDDFLQDKETGTDATARDQNGNPTKNINSQAWVFYSLQDDGKTPELSEGIALRFVYDVLYMSNKTGNSPRGVATWPLPHHKGFGTYQQIILSVAHGHNWVEMQDEKGYYGADSRDYKEFYLHGAKIIWDGLNNKIADVQLRREGISDPNGITNIEAALYGHIAIPTDGSAPYVSYTPASDDDKIDMDGAKIGVIIPRTLHDSRIGIDGKTINKEYPIVKIGFNQFWMSKSLRAKTLRDGTPLKSFNESGKMGLTFGDFAKDGVGVLDPGYLYCYNEIDKNSVSTFDPANNLTSEEREELRIAALYNYSAFENELLTPLSPESHYAYHAPYVDDMDKLMHYFGYVFSAKMSTKGVWEGINNKNIPDINESKRQALLNGEWTSSNCDLYCSNISGFNLRPMGFINNDLTDTGGNPGDVAALLLLTRDRDQGVSYASFNSWNCWSSSEFSGFYPNQSKLIYDISAWQREQCISRLCAQVRYFMRFKNQQDAVYYGEGGTDFARSLGRSIKKSLKSQSTNQESRHNGNVVYLQLKR